MKKYLALAALMIIPSVAPADMMGINFIRYTIPVNQIDANTFEVIEADGAGGAQLWCAAGLFARSELGQRLGTLSIVSPRGEARTEPGRKGVIFTTQPVENATTSYSASVRNAGLSFSMTHARSFCRSDFGSNVRVRTSDGRLIRD